MSDGGPHFARPAWHHSFAVKLNATILPIGLLVLTVLFAAYAYGRRREVSELKHLLRDLQDRATSVTPSEEQLDQLGIALRGK